jgi:LuxR family maltose regulon positive regulatory protein
LLDPLSAREQDVLRLLARGASNQEIADALVVATSTIKHHVSNILSKLEVTNRTQAVARARALGLLSREE